jgi:hypothetical protein
VVDRGWATQRFAAALTGVPLLVAVSACNATLPSPGAGPSTVPSTANPSPTTSTAPTTWPTIAPSPATVPAQLDLGSLGFWTLEQPMAAVDLSLNPLRVGTLDGRVTRALDLHNPGKGPLNLSLQPEPVGPAGGRMLYVADDGRKATLHVVAVATGADHVLLTATAFIAAMALDPSGSTAYAVTLDRTTGVFVAVEAVATAGGQARPIIKIGDLGPDAATPCTPVVGISYDPRFAVSTDGRWIVLASFRPSGCGLVAVPTDGGALLAWPGFRIDEQIVGIAGDLLIGSSPCAQATCDGFVVDLRTGLRWPLGGAQDLFDPKQLIAGVHGPLVLGDGGDYVKGEWQVEALDLTDRSRSSVFAATFTPVDTAVHLAEQHLAEMPAGWFLIYRNIEGAPLPEPAYSAGTIGGKTELPLPIMTIPKH